MVRKGGRLKKDAKNETSHNSALAVRLRAHPTWPGVALRAILHLSKFANARTLDDILLGWRLKLLRALFFLT